MYTLKSYTLYRLYKYDIHTQLHIYILGYIYIYIDIELLLDYIRLSLEFCSLVSLSSHRKKLLGRNRFVKSFTEFWDFSFVTYPFGFESLRHCELVGDYKLKHFRILITITQILKMTRIPSIAIYNKHNTCTHTRKSSQLHFF